MNFKTKRAAKEVADVLGLTVYKSASGKWQIE